MRAFPALGLKSLAFHNRSSRGFRPREPPEALPYPSPFFRPGARPAATLSSHLAGAGWVPPGRPLGGGWERGRRAPRTEDAPAAGGEHGDSAGRAGGHSANGRGAQAAEARRAGALPYALRSRGTVGCSSQSSWRSSASASAPELPPVFPSSFPRGIPLGSRARLLPPSPLRTVRTKASRASWCSSRPPFPEKPGCFFQEWRRWPTDPGGP